jgi:hypothetical protein
VSECVCVLHICAYLYLYMCISVYVCMISQSNVVFILLLLVPSRYSITASPSLMYEFQAASRALGSFASHSPTQSSTSPLYVMMLRHPVSRMVSLYNHWFVQERNTGAGVREMCV